MATVGDAMTASPRCVDSGATVTEVAQQMRAGDVG
jgi:hypothetical protein